MSNVEIKPEQATAVATATAAAQRPSDAEQVKARWPLAMSIGIAGLLLLFVLLVGIMYYFTRSFEPGKAKTDEPAPAKKLSELLHANDEELTNYGWVDRKKKIVRVPIERAMELVVNEGEGEVEAKAKAKARVKEKETEKAKVNENDKDKAKDKDKDKAKDKDKDKDKTDRDDSKSKNKGTK